MASPKDPKAPGLGKDKVVGYAYAGQYRAPVGGYSHTAELSIFVAPACIGWGIGSLMIDKLLCVLREPGINREYTHEDDLQPVVTEVMCCMAVDVEGREGGMGLRDWYLRWGFREVGRFEKVGYKLGRW